MALQDLLRAIEDEAAAERATADRKASAEAVAIIERARHEAGTVEAALATAPEAQTRAEAERDVSLARLAAAATVRVAREEAFASLLAGIQVQLAGARGSDTYRARFRALIAESRAALPAARELRVDPRDLELADSTAGDLRVVAALDTFGGVELVDDDGRTVRNTLEERLANAEMLLRRRFMRWLASPTQGQSASVR
jgi:V/A-type H+/Na+-transporting ATPase subunit E